MSIADSKIRAAVWQGAGHGRRGRWYVDVYYAARRGDPMSPVWRAAVDGDTGAEVIEGDFASRLEALDYAERTVGLMRITAALVAAASAGMVTVDEALAGLGRDDDREVDCDA